jgi:hypothetical protein
MRNKCSKHKRVRLHRKFKIIDTTLNPKGLKLKTKRITPNFEIGLKRYSVRNEPNELS